MSFRVLELMTLLVCELTNWRIDKLRGVGDDWRSSQTYWV